jgi:hypothetical protein
MAERKEGEKTLEMRVAELEDKLKGLQITEEEMRAYNKVASLMGGAAPQAADPSAALTPVPGNCIISQCIRSCTVVQNCIRACTVVQNCIRACTVIQNCIRACTIIQDCINECGGGCAPGGGGFVGGGGFGSLGG